MFSTFSNICYIWPLPTINYLNSWMTLYFDFKGTLHIYSLHTLIAITMATANQNSFQFVKHQRFFLLAKHSYFSAKEIFCTHVLKIFSCWSHVQSLFQQMINSAPMATVLAECQHCWGSASHPFLLALAPVGN